MRHNTRITFAETLFSFHGRIGRLRFIGFSCLVGAFYLPLFIATIVFARESALRDGAYSSLIGLFFLPWILTLVVGASLLTKRLHDLGRSRVHVIWIFIVLFAPSEPVSDAAALVIQIIAIAAMAWVSMMPGTDGSNKYGINLE